MQVSALDQELIEVDPDTKEMLKLLVSLSLTVQSSTFLPTKYVYSSTILLYLSILILCYFILSLQYIYQTAVVTLQMNVLKTCNEHNIYNIL